MKKLLKAFIKDSSGATVIEWVVIVAAGVGITIAVLSSMAPSIGNLALSNANCLDVNDGKGCL